MKVRKLYFLIVAMVLLSLLIIPSVFGCAKPAPAPAPTSAPTSAPAPAPKPTATAAPVSVKWNVAVGQPKGHYLIAPVAEWADAMDKGTNGRWKITIHYSGSLAETVDALDGLKAGLFQGAPIGALYYAGKMPLQTVAELPFYWPSNFEVILKIIQETKDYPVLAKWMADKWDTKLLFANSSMYHEILSNKPVRTNDDFKGLRVRTGGEAGKLLTQFGAVPTTFAASEQYTALERGTVDAVITSIPGAWGWSLHEVTKYLTINFALTTGYAAFGVKKSTFDGLPEEFRKLAQQWADEKYLASNIAGASKGEADAMPVFKSKLQIIEFSPTDRAKLVAAAQPIYDKWVTDREKDGLPGKEIMDYFLTVRKKYAAK